MKTQTSKIIPELFTATELAKKLGVCRRTITNWTKRQIIPGILVGRVRRYDMDRVKAALAKFEQVEAIC